MSSRLLHPVHDHSSVPCSSVFVRVIWCGLDNRTPISSQPSALTASRALPSHAPLLTDRRGLPPTHGTMTHSQAAVKVGQPLYQRARPRCR
jgi:hypothetical protein